MCEFRYSSRPTLCQFFNTTTDFHAAAREADFIQPSIYVAIPRALIYSPQPEKRWLSIKMCGIVPERVDAINILY